MSFQETKYQVIKQALSYELANFIFNYFLLKRDAVAWMYKNNVTYDSGMLGTWTDKQIPNTYSHYSDPVMETLLMKVLPRMQDETGLSLVPTYSYARLYKQGDILKRHKDRPSCEISTTIHLGGDRWSIFMDPTGSDNVIDEYKNIHKPNAPKGNEVILDIGDMLVYSGCDLEHWREEFRGNNCAQVFLHYNKKGSKTAKENEFDKRPFLGLPAWYKGFTLPKK